MSLQWLDVYLLPFEHRKSQYQLTIDDLAKNPNFWAKCKLSSMAPGIQVYMDGVMEGKFPTLTGRALKEHRASYSKQNALHCKPVLEHARGIFRAYVLDAWESDRFKPDYKKAVWSDPILVPRYMSPYLKAQAIPYTKEQMLEVVEAWGTEREEIERTNVIMTYAQADYLWRALADSRAYQVLLGEAENVIEPERKILLSPGAFKKEPRYYKQNEWYWNEGKAME